jgi:hypothetical protein
MIFHNHLIASNYVRRQEQTRTAIINLPKLASGKILVIGVPSISCNSSFNSISEAPFLLRLLREFVFYSLNVNSNGTAVMQACT